MRATLSGFPGHAEGDHARCPALGCRLGRQARLRRLVQEGLGGLVIAQRLGLSYATVHADLLRGRRAGWLPPAPGRLGR